MRYNISWGISLNGPPSSQAANRRPPRLAATLPHMARQWPVYFLVRHGPFLARLVFSNKKACLVSLMGKGPKLRMSTGPRLGCYATEAKAHIIDKLAGYFYKKTKAYSATTFLLSALAPALSSCLLSIITVVVGLLTRNHFLNQQCTVAYAFITFWKGPGTTT